MSAHAHHRYACQALAVAFVGCVLAAMVGYWVSDREVDE